MADATDPDVEKVSAPVAPSIEAPKLAAAKFGSDEAACWIWLLMAVSRPACVLIPVRPTLIVTDPEPPKLPVLSKVKVAARVSLGGVLPSDVRVQAYYGVLTADGKIAEGGEHLDLVLRQSWGTDHLYEGEVECGQSGSCGFAVRVIPFHEDAVLPYEMPWVRWSSKRLWGAIATGQLRFRLKALNLFLIISLSR